VTRFHFVASERHFFDHLAPIWDLLEPEERGQLIRPAERPPSPYVVGSVENPPRKAQPNWRQTERTPSVFGPEYLTVVAAWGDYWRSVRAGHRTVLFEHGLGQTYIDGTASYAGSSHPLRGSAVAFIVPNDHAAQANLAAHPEVPTYVVGVPRLDRWHQVEPRPRSDPPVVAVSFHWECRVAPETRSSWEWFLPGLASLQREYTVLGHGHPRIWDTLEPAYRHLNIEAVKDFDEVMERADLYVCDNSSTLFEFASTGRPVMVLNAPWYRRDVEHGLRFWRCAEVGVNCDDPADLVDAVARALDDPPEVKRARERALDYALPLRDGRSAERAVTVLRSLRPQTV
jgi:glycosyltransferase involved in cell wall biosynthesis